MIMGSKRDVESAGCCIVRSSDGSLYVVGNDIAARLNRYEELERENERLLAENCKHKAKFFCIAKAAVEYGGMHTPEGAEKENCVSCQAFWEIFDGGCPDADKTIRAITDRNLELQAEVEKLKDELKGEDDKEAE
jgi:hypothetical protein